MDKGSSEPELLPMSSPSGEKRGPSGIEEEGTYMEGGEFELGGFALTGDFWR